VESSSAGIFQSIIDDLGGESLAFNGVG